LIFDILIICNKRAAKYDKTSFILPFK
jgi:hypothetical protein